MAQTVMLALGRTAATSSVITVTTTPVTVSLYSDSVDGLTGFCSINGVCPIVMDTPATPNVQLTTRETGPVNLSNDQSQWVLSAPGDYYVVRPALPSTAPQLGVFVQT
jgi:hypothetical protein